MDDDFGCGSDNLCIIYFNYQYQQINDKGVRPFI